MIRSTGFFLLRLCRITCGFLLLIAGVILSLPGIPGPGIVVLVLGLGLLSHDFHWAERIRSTLHQKWQEILARRRRPSDPNLETKEKTHG